MRAVACSFLPVVSSVMWQGVRKHDDVTGALMGVIVPLSYLTKRKSTASPYFVVRINRRA